MNVEEKKDKEEFMLDTWSASGTNEEHIFEMQIRELADARHTLQAQKYDIIFLSLLGSDPNEAKQWLAAIPGSLLKYDKKKEMWTIRSPQNIQMGDDAFTREMQRQLCAVIYGKTYEISNTALFSLAQRCGINAPVLKAMPSSIQALTLGSIFDSPQMVKMVVQKTPTKKKIIGFFGEGYVYIPQTVLLDIAHNIRADGTAGLLKCRKWKITNALSRVQYAIPEEAKKFGKLPNKFTPEIVLSTSDCGDTAVECRSILTWRGGEIELGNTSVYHARCKAKEAAQTITDGFFKELFPKYEEAAKVLRELASIKINSKDINHVLRTVSKKAGLNKAIGKKIEAAYMKKIMGEQISTYYDAAVKLMSVTGTKEVRRMSDDMKIKIEKAAALIPEKMIELAKVKDIAKSA